MTAKGVSPTQLMSCSDADFDNSINNMAVKDLMGLISSLQKEMAKEQENFNSLSGALQGLKDRNSRQYKTISRDMVASQGRLTTLMNRSMKCFSQVNGVPSLTAGGRVQGQYVKRTAAPSKAPTPATSTAPATTNGRTELEKVHARLRTPRDVTLSALPDKPTTPVSSMSPTVQNGGSREVTYFTTNLDRKKSSSSIVLGQRSDFDDDVVDSSASAFARPSSPSQGMQLSPLRKAQSREELYAIESKARVQKDAMLKEIGNKKSDSAEEDAYNAIPVSGHWGLKGNSLLAQRLQKDEQERTEQTTAPPPSTKNTTPHSPITNGNLGWGGGGGGGGGLSISIRSTSRENLAEPDPPVTKKQSVAPAKGGKSAPPPSSSSTSSSTSRPSSTQASSSAQQQANNKVKVTTTIMPAVAATTAPVPKRTAPTAPSSAKTTPAVSKTTIPATAAATKTTPPPAVTIAPAATKTAPAETKTAPATVKTAEVPVSDRSQNKATPRPVSATTETGKTEEEFTDLDDENTPRMNLINWDPKPVLDELYKVKLQEETAEDISHNFVSMEGLMEKLPMNKKKSTLLKTWKRRFFRAQDGWLQYYETGNRDKPSETLQLMGGHIDDMGNRILGIDDGRGHYLMVRAPTDKEHGQWKVALESQTADNTKATYVQPVLRSAPHSTKNVVVIDMGSSAIRAGVLGEKESLPQVFFPSVVAVHKETGKKVVGAEAYHPEVRKHSTLLHPIRPSNRVDQGVMKKFNIDVDMMSAIFRKVFDELKVNPSQYMVMLSTPQTLSDSLRAGLMNALVENLGVQGVCMVQQSLLALYSYRTSTGIIVDIGHRIEILPIYDGFVIEGGVARCPYGSQKVIDSLKKALLETNFKFASEVELLLVRYIMEQSCYVATDYRDEETLCETQPGKLKRDIHLNKFNLPEGAYKTVEIEEGRFSSPEGFFNVDLWEMDYPTLHKLIFHAIQSCPMDNRRHMYRSVYLSGGVTMLPGFQDRLLTELKKLAPPAVTVEVHAAANRYHAAYLGACSVASMPQFKDMAISRDEWRREGARAFRKWQTAGS